MRVQNSSSSPRLFVYLALTTALLTIGLIVFGAIVRVTDSGLGCGNDWPLCDGRVVPPLDNITAWIEWSHRLIAALIGLFGLGMLVFAWRGYRAQNQLVLSATLIAAVLFVVQSGLGALVVILDLPPTMVTLHLGTAMLLLGALLVAAISAWYKPRIGYPRDQVTMLAYITAALSLVIILTGALVRGSGATLACIDWPLCNGEVLPFDQGQLQTVHVLHRFSVVGLGISLLMLVWYVWQTRRDMLLRAVMAGALLVYLSQAMVGALFVLSEAAPVWGAAHVGLASMTWALLVIGCLIDTLNSRESIRNQQSEQEWKPQSEVATL